MDTELETLIATFVSAQEASRSADRDLIEAKAELVGYMEQHQRKTVKLQMGEDKIAQVTYTKPQRFSVDEKGLRRALTAKVFDSFTDRKLNQARLQAAMDTGEIDPMVVAKYLSENDSKPQLRYSTHATEVMEK